MPSSNEQEGCVSDVLADQAQEEMNADHAQAPNPLPVTAVWPESEMQNAEQFARDLLSQACIPPSCLLNT